MKPYSTYKKTEVDWLPEIPAHWERVPIRGLTRIVSERGRPDLPLLSVYRDFGVLMRTEDDENHNVIPEDLSNYKVVRPNNLVLNKMKTWQGSLGVSEYEGIVSPAYIVCELLGENNPRFIHRLLRTRRYIFAWKRISYGVRVDQWDMRYIDFKQVPVFLPPLEEQNAIVEFLETKEREIGEFIEKKRRTIELLKEQKAAVINRAVTRGINDNAPIKSSGIDWLGDIPAHWEVKKLKLVASFNPSKNRKLVSQYLDEKVSFLPMEKVSVDGQIDDSIRMPYQQVSEGFTYFEKNDVILAKITPCFENGKGAYLSELETELGFGSTEFIVIRATKKVSPKFLYLITSSEFFRVQGAEFMTGSAGQKRVPTEFVKNFALGFPPLAEQKEIVAYIERKNAEINAVIRQAEREIELMNEYRASLIDAAVTGKIDCRVQSRVQSSRFSVSSAPTAKRDGAQTEVWTLNEFEPTIETKSDKFNPFWRTVVGAEIVSQMYEDETFGHVKFTKVFHLAEHFARLENFRSNYFRHEKGPHDRSLLESVEGIMKRNGYFELVRDGDRYFYRPLKNFGKHQKYYEEHWQHKKAEIQKVIDLLKPLDTERCEIVSTLFAVWNDFIIEARTFTDEDIVNEVLTNWDESKKEIETRRWFGGLKWMRDNGLVPTGFGKHTKLKM